MRTTIVAALAAVLVWTSASPATAAAKYRAGEYITVRGRVVDFDGRPLAGVTVLLEPSRRPFKLFQRKRDREPIDRLQIPTRSDGAGEYSFEWRWDPFYDTFELAIAVPTVAGGQQSFEVLHRTDFSDRMMNGSPVTVELEVEDPSRLSRSRSWTPPPATGTEPPVTSTDLLHPPGQPARPARPAPPPPERRTEAAGSAASAASSEDQRRILSELGQPDQIDRHDRLEGIETSWWYFEVGKVYYFLDGKLSQVSHFDPIQPP
jgi:hypothetical protein